MSNQAPSAPSRTINHLELTCPTGVRAPLNSILRQQHLQSGDITRHGSVREMELNSGSVASGKSKQTRIHLGLDLTVQQRIAETTVEEVIRKIRLGAFRGTAHQLIFGAQRIYDNCRRLARSDGPRIDYVVTPTTDITVGGKNLHAGLDLRNGRPLFVLCSPQDKLRGTTAVLVGHSTDSAFAFLEVVS